MKRGELDSAIRRAYNLFDAWNQVTGFVPPGSSYYDEMMGCIEDAVHCGAQAATGDFKRLENEKGPIAGAPRLETAIALVPDQPDGCQCSPNSWGVEGFMPICDNYEQCTFGDCKHCNHDEVCHAPTAGGES